MDRSLPSIVFWTDHFDCASDVFWTYAVYWLFSLCMSRKQIERVQLDADVLWWSKEPDLNKPQYKRFRRFVARRSAIGTRDQGGLGNMWIGYSQDDMAGH